MIEIYPSILVNTFSDFESQLKKMEGIFERIQIDVMDGVFVKNKSFDDIKKINKLQTKWNFELHLMVEDPLKEMEKWQDINGVFRVIFHIESKADPMECISYARGKCWQVGIALNPETPVDAVRPYAPLVDVVLFLAVNPGRQGAPFVPAVLEKIKEFSKWPDHPLCAIDGGVNQNTIKALKDAGVELFSVGSAITMAEDPGAAYAKLKELI